MAKIIKKITRSIKSDVPINEENITNAIFKKATGYECEEVVEEYVSNDDKLVLSKRKVTTKHIAPDMQAAKIVLELLKENGFNDMTDEELIKERDRLIELLNKTKEEEMES